MKVVAIRDGFFNGRRIRAHTVFDVPSKTKGKWFVPADKYVAPPDAGKQAQAMALSQIGRQTPKSFVEAMKKPVDPNAKLVEDDADALLK